MWFTVQKNLLSLLSFGCLTFTNRSEQQVGSHCPHNVVISGKAMNWNWKEVFSPVLVLICHINIYMPYKCIQKKSVKGTDLLLETASSGHSRNHRFPIFRLALFFSPGGAKTYNICTLYRYHKMCVDAVGKVTIIFNCYPWWSFPSPAESNLKTHIS